MAKPTAVPPVMMATAVIESSPSARQIITSTGANATNSTSPRVSMMKQNSTNIDSTNIDLRSRYFSASVPIDECMAPDLITTAKAAPEHSSMNSRSTALLAPLAMCSGISSGLTGLFSTQWNDAASTTEREPTLTRSNSPAGMSHVARQAATTTEKMITSVFIAFFGFAGAAAAFTSSDITKPSSQIRFQR